MRKVQVPLGDRSYTIWIGPGLFKQIGKNCQKLGLGKKCAVITDSTVGPLYGQVVLDSLQSTGFEPVLITIPAGEKSKSLPVVEKVYDQLAQHRLERKSFVLALGGGVVGDLAGFVAATYLRGISFVQCPTTLLSQVDSSVGGKVGVNLKAGKNLVGAFYQPKAVWCDLETLNSLPDREYRAGLAEVIKYGIIYDAGFFKKLEKSMPQLLAKDPALLAPIVARCCEIKAQVVGADETESGLRAILNFGHTIGHGLEAISQYGKYLHGEAISIGQILAARLSAQILGLTEGEVHRIEKIFQQTGLPTQVRLAPKQLKALEAAMMLDKKVSGGEIKFVLARSIGRVEFGQKVPLDLVRQTLLNAA